MGTLDGIRVLEAGLLVQGPQAALTMLEWGADVIKVELPGFGDQSRWLPISREDRRSAFFSAYNRGKRSVTVDLRVPQGREVFLRLVEHADVVITNFKPGTMEGWGLGYDDLAERNPRIVYAVGSSFGQRGPDAAREGADLSAQAAGGLISTTGGNGNDPSPVGATVADHISGRTCSPAILAALYAREHTGRGQMVETSLLGRPDLGPGRRIHPVPHVGTAIGTERPEPPDDPRHLRRLPDLGRVDRHRRHGRPRPRPLLPDHRQARPDRPLQPPLVLRGRQGGAVADPRPGLRDQADGRVVRAARRRRLALRSCPRPRRGGQPTPVSRRTATSRRSGLRTPESRPRPSSGRRSASRTHPPWSTRTSPSSESTPSRCSSRSAIPGTTSAPSRRTVQSRRPTAGFTVP